MRRQVIEEAVTKEVTKNQRLVTDTVIAAAELGGDNHPVRYDDNHSVRW